MNVKPCRSFAAIALAGLIALAPVAPAWGQNQAPAPAQTQPQAAQPAPNAPQPITPFRFPAGTDFTRPNSAFPHIWLPYMVRPVEDPQITNAPRLSQMIHDGKLSISVQDAIELALENNPDIGVQRYYKWMAQTDILRAKAGSTPRGVASASTPFPFATLPLPSYDPVITSTLSLDSRRFPANNPLTSGVGTSAATVQALQTDTGIANLQYTQSFHTGTTFSLALNTTRASTSSSAVFFNPDVQTTGTFSFSQPLMNGFGLLSNERYIRVSYIAQKAVDSAFQQSLITDITAVADDYWELVFARGNVNVNLLSVQLAQQLYNDNQKQVEVGTLAPIEVVRAEAQLATAQQNLIAAQTVQLQQQILLMSVIAKNPMAPELQNVEIIPTDTAQEPPVIENMPLADAVNEALQHRPDVQEAHLTIDADNINVKVTRNALLPNLTLSGFVTSVGLSGNSKITALSAGTGSQIVGPLAAGVPTQLTVLDQATGTIIPIFVPSSVTAVTGINQSGFGSALNQLFHGSFPEAELQLSLNLPVRNRAAQADSARAQLAQRQDQARLIQTINNVAVDVHNAQITLQQDRTAVVAAQKTRVLQEQTLDADQKKLALGAATIFEVVTDQQLLSAAGSAEVRAEVNLVEARVNFERALGRTIDVNKVIMANAQTGVVPKDTLIPGTTPDGQLVKSPDSTN